MYGEVLQAVRTLAIQSAMPYTTIEHGSTPMGDSLAMYLAAGGERIRYRDKGKAIELTYVLNGKHTNLQTLLSALSNIHEQLELRTEYPQGARWAITNIETGTPPTYLDREQSDGNRWLYGSMLSVYVKVRGMDKCQN